MPYPLEIGDEDYSVFVSPWNDRNNMRRVPVTRLSVSSAVNNQTSISFGVPLRAVRWDIQPYHTLVHVFERDIPIASGVVRGGRANTTENGTVDWVASSMEHILFDFRHVRSYGKFTSADLLTILRWLFAAGQADQSLDIHVLGASSGITIDEHIVSANGSMDGAQLISAEVTRLLNYDDGFTWWVEPRLDYTSGLIWALTVFPGRLGPSTNVEIIGSENANLTSVDVMRFGVNDTTTYGQSSTGTGNPEFRAVDTATLDTGALRMESRIDTDTIAGGGSLQSIGDRNNRVGKNEYVKFAATTGPGLFSWADGRVGEMVRGAWSRTDDGTQLWFDGTFKVTSKTLTLGGSQSPVINWVLTEDTLYG